MINVIIVEDDAASSRRLEQFVKRYFTENPEPYTVKTYENGLDFISEYQGGANVIFMDIEMPHMDGLKASRRLRAVDTYVSLIFVTNMAQLAIRGYKVSAKAFIVKPVAYFDFALELDKIRKEVERRGVSGLWVNAGGAMRKVAFADIRYIEVAAHDICIHTKGEKLTFRGSLKHIEEKLPQDLFSRCNSCYIVNLAYMYEVREDVAVLEDGTELRISRPRRKQFLSSLADYIAGANVK